MSSSRPWCVDEFLPCLLRVYCILSPLRALALAFRVAGSASVKDYTHCGWQAWRLHCGQSAQSRQSAVMSPPAYCLAQDHLLGSGLAHSISVMDPADESPGSAAMLGTLTLVAVHYRCSPCALAGMRGEPVNVDGVPFPGAQGEGEDNAALVHTEPIVRGRSVSNRRTRGPAMDAAAQTCKQRRAGRVKTNQCSRS